MPVIGLPNVLELSLSNILEDLSVSSWNIKGDSDFMQVWIRFKMEDSCNTTGDKTNIYIDRGRCSVAALDIAMSYVFLPLSRHYYD